MSAILYLNLMMSMILAHFFSSAFSMRTSRRNLKGMKPVRNRDNFGESPQTLSAVESQSWVSS